MKKTTLLICIFALGVFTILNLGLFHHQEKPPIYEVYFSPGGGCTEAIIKQIDQSKTTILIQAYYFTSAQIAKALLEAHKRNVVIDVLLDKSQLSHQYSSATFFRNSGIRVRIDAKHKIAHNKIIIIDSTTVITGSFNFTRAAEESNAENLLIIRDNKLAEKYIQNWKHHAEHSTPY